MFYFRGGCGAATAVLTAAPPLRLHRRAPCFASATLIIYHLGVSQQGAAADAETEAERVIVNSSRRVLGLIIIIIIITIIFRRITPLTPTPQASLDLVAN